MSALDCDKQGILVEFRERVSDVLHCLKNDFHRSDDILVKFLIGRGYNVDNAEEMLRKTVEWRQANDVNSILERPFCHELDPYYKVLFPGFDKLGRPLFIAQAGRWDPLGLLHPKATAEATTITIQFLEKGINVCEMLSKVGKSITKCFVIIDCAEFDYKHLANTEVITTGLGLLRENAQMVLDNYPDCVYKVVVVNAPSVFHIVWAVLKPLLPPASLARFLIYGANTDSWKDYLLKRIDADVLPSQYGGANTTGLLDCHFEVDKDFIPTNNLELLPLEEMLECYIEPGRSFTVDIKTQPGDRLVWNFKTETYDIGFNVECDDDNRVIIEQCRVDAHKFTQKGRLNCLTGAKYTLTWDNSYSYWTGKKLFYVVTDCRFEVHEFLFRGEIWLFPQRWKVKNLMLSSLDVLS